MPSDPETATTRATAARLAEHAAALHSLREFAHPLAPPDPVRVIDARLAALVEVYNREWEEFDVEAATAFRDSADALGVARVESVRIYGGGV